MGRQTERVYENDVKELRAKAAAERKRGRESVAKCLDHMADQFQHKVDLKNAALYQQ